MSMFEVGATRRGAALCLVMCAAVLAACRESSFPVPATYNLVGGDGGALPLALAADSACFTRLHSGSLVFEDRESYQANYHILATCTHGIDTLPDPGVRGRYRIRGDVVEFLDPSGRPTGSGTLSADSIVIRGPQHSLSFRRAAQIQR